ncbi:acyl-CoA Delta-9 desaturase-like isoform X2 [Hylaeus anthracinus]|uniref:acyl-CoA Delta-9 desaturase-like isoform X2 n=1 Tax=Hylaeus anthracinus TaxID=313031 RepID=UPI0023B8ABC8|nr:acyl-CoA Delta-9 desaturase-like isoform X2 [Hylaeus anthracinus]
MYSSTVTEYEEKKNDDRHVEEIVESFKLSKGRALTETPIIWENVIGMAALHALAIYGFVQGYRDAKFWTWMWHIGIDLFIGYGITAGAHRLWAHRCYSAKLPLRLILAFAFCMSAQKRPYSWIRDHRTHHKYTETPADPHNANRGFFFSHIGWLLVKRHPAVKEYGSKVDMSDIRADPVLEFCDKYFEIIMVTSAVVLPVVVPVYGWGETWFISIFANILRYIVALHLTFLVNSFAHMWGNRPYNRELRPTENAIVSFFALGEGWHNYHHAFPWDYKAAELGAYGLNTTTGFIDLMARLGLAYDLKTPEKELVDRVSLKKGDGTDSYWGHSRHRNVTPTAPVD